MVLWPCESYFVWVPLTLIVDKEAVTTVINGFSFVFGLLHDTKIYKWIGYHCSCVRKNSTTLFSNSKTTESIKLHEILFPCLKRKFHQLHDELYFIQIRRFKVKLESFFWNHQFSTWATLVYQSATIIKLTDRNRTKMPCSVIIMQLQYNSKVSVLFIFHETVKHITESIPRKKIGANRCQSQTVW